MSTYADRYSSLTDMRESLERISLKLSSVVGKVGKREDDLEDVRTQVSEALRLLPEDGDVSDDARTLYQSTLDLYQAFVDVLAVDGLNAQAASLNAANGKAIETLSQHIKDLEKSRDVGDFFSKLAAMVKDLCESIFGGIGIVLGGAIVIGLVYLYIKGRK